MSWYSSRVRARGADNPGAFSIDWVALAFSVIVTSACAVYSAVYAEDGGLIGLLAKLAG